VHKAEALLKEEQGPIFGPFDHLAMSYSPSEPFIYLFFPFTTGYITDN